MPVFFRCARVRMRCVAPTFRAKTILPSDGRRFGKRKQGILDKLSRRGLRMRRKADADNSRIGASSGRCRLLSLDFFACSCAFVESTDGDSAEYAVRSNFGGLLPSVRCRGIFDKVYKNDSGTALKRFPNRFSLLRGKIVRASDATDCGQRRVSRSSIRCFRRGGRRLRRSASSDRSPNMI